MPIKVREINNISILDIEGRIDINSSDIIETVGWLTSGGKLKILLNLENVDIVDYSGLSVLAIAYKNVANHKGVLKLLKVPLPMTELLKVVKLDTVFEVYADEDAAISSFCEEAADMAHLRRRFKRLDIHIKVVYWRAEGQKRPKAFEGNALNLSATGVYIYTPSTFPMNTMLEMKIELPNIAAPLELAGKVVWLPDKEIQEHSYPGMGVSFLHLDSEKEKAVADFIDKNITYRAE